MNIRRLTNMVVNLSTESLTYFLLAIAMLGILALIIIPKSSDMGLFLSQFSILLVSLSIFCIGLLFFVRKEHPISIARQWFGITRYSSGAWAQVYGCMLMTLGGFVLVGVLFRLIRFLAQWIGL